MDAKSHDNVVRMFYANEKKSPASYDAGRHKGNNKYCEQQGAHLVGKAWPAALIRAVGQLQHNVFQVEEIEGQGKVSRHLLMGAA
jgi:hypothetical protein